MIKKTANRLISTKWNKVANYWAYIVRKGDDIYREKINNPAIFKLLQHIKDKKILDLGCGEGYNTRILAKKGAKVIGVDISEKLINFAWQTENDKRLGIKYFIADASNLSMLKKNYFDLVVSFMAIMDMKNCKKIFEEVSRILKPSGRLIFSILHPCFSYYRKNLGWEKDRKGKGLYYKIDYYFDEGVKEIPFVIGAGKYKLPLKMITFHRTLTSYSSALNKADFIIKRIIEPIPSKSAIEKHRFLRHNLRIPNFLLIEATRN